MKESRPATGGWVRQLEIGGTHSGWPAQQGGSYRNLTDSEEKSECSEDSDSDLSVVDSDSDTSVDEDEVTEVGEGG